MAIKYVFNPFTGKFDAIDTSSGSAFDEDTIVTEEATDSVVIDENGNVVVSG